MSIFIIKIIACLTMVLDHIKYAIPETKGWLTIYLGRIAFPLYAFLATEGANLVSTFTNGGRQVVIKGAAYSVGDSSIAGTYNRVKNIRRFAMSEFNI